MTTNPFNVLAPVNNAELDPFQGYDADVFILNQITGNYILIGRFVSIQIIIDHVLEPYLGVNKRMPKYLDGEINITWQMERGQLDSRILEQTFGYKSVSPTMFIDKLPIFQISFIVSAEGLGSNERMAAGEMVLSFCKIKRFTLAATAGKSVIANRWEGTAEGVTFINRKANELADNTTLNTKSNYGAVNNMFTDWYQSAQSGFQW